MTHLNWKKTLFNMKSRLYLIIACLVISAATYAQSRTIKAVLKDAETGVPVIGANITIPNDEVGVVSNLDGFFSISVNG